jgi:hypothetical protein
MQVALDLQDHARQCSLLYPWYFEPVATEPD